MTRARSRRIQAPERSELERFYRSLPVGRANALTWRALAARLGLPARHADRILRNLTQHCIESNLLVCSTNRGYFVPLTMEEARESIGRIASQGALMSQRARHMQQLANARFLYQERLV